MNYQITLSLIAGIFISGVSAYLGSLMLSKRMSLVAGPLGHLTLPGIAIALLHGFSVSLGAFPFILLGIVLIWLLEIKTKLPMEALTAVVFASGVAVAFLFLPINQAQAALVGEITTINKIETLVSTFLAVAVFFIIKIIYPKMVLINISQDLAKSEGINVKKYNLIYLLLIAVIVSLGVQMVGGLLTAALVAIPPAAARNISKTLSQYCIMSIVIGVTAACIGILLYTLTKLPSGPLIICVNAVFFLISLLLQK